MIELIFALGLLEPCISLSVADVNHNPKEKLLIVEVAQKLKKDPLECGVKRRAAGYKWIVVDQNENQIADMPVEFFPAEVGLKNKIMIINPSLPKDFKPPLTFKVLK